MISRKTAHSARPWPGRPSSERPNCVPRRWEHATSLPITRSCLAAPLLPWPRTLSNENCLIRIQHPFGLLEWCCYLLSGHCSCVTPHGTFYYLLRTRCLRPSGSCRFGRSELGQGGGLRQLQRSSSPEGRISRGCGL